MIAWLKKCWWALAAALAAAFAFFRPRSRTVVVDPLDTADARHRDERDRREVALADEEAKLQAELDAMQAETVALLEHLEAADRERYERLKEDPQALAEWLREVGRRAHP